MSFNYATAVVPEDTLAKLKQSGYRMTPQRLAVVRAIVQSDECLTPAALHQKVRRQKPGIGLVTVYRTLNILVALGLVCEVHLGENGRGYVGRPVKHHDHLVCAGCGKVVNFTGCNVGPLERRLARETGFAITGHHLELVGRCCECGRTPTKCK